MLKIGVLGTGHLGKIHLKCIQLADAAYELVGFFDPNEKIAAAIAAEYGITAFPDAQSLIDAADVVDIVTPTTTHYVLAKQVIVATGSKARHLPNLPVDQKIVMDNEGALNQESVPKKLAIIGAGGIGFDMAEYLSHKGESPSLDTEKYMEEWGVDMAMKTGGALMPAQPEPSPREIYLLKRSPGKHGKNLGKTTGWAHRRAE